MRTRKTDRGLVSSVRWQLVQAWTKVVPEGGTEADRSENFRWEKFIICVGVFCECYSIQFFNEMNMIFVYMQHSPLLPSYWLNISTKVAKHTTLCWTNRYIHFIESYLFNDAVRCGSLCLSIVVKSWIAESDSLSSATSRQILSPQACCFICKEGQWREDRAGHQEVTTEYTGCCYLFLLIDWLIDDWQIVCFSVSLFLKHWKKFQTKCQE